MTRRLTPQEKSARDESRAREKSACKLEDIIQRLNAVIAQRELERMRSPPIAISPETQALIQRLTTNHDATDATGTVLRPQTYSSFKERIRSLGRATNITLQIEYRGSDGLRTRRKIDVKFLYPTRGYPSHLLAYCHLREEDRTFNMPSIISANEYSSGEEISELGLWLQAH